MAEKEVPTYRCTYCLSALPEDQQQPLFGSESLRPKSDEADCFVMEAQNIMRYAAAVTTLFIDAERIGDDVTHQLQSLVRELTEEALRRLERAGDALDIVWEREEAAKKATQARKEGV